MHLLHYVFHLVSRDLPEVPVVMIPSFFSFVALVLEEPVGDDGKLFREELFIISNILDSFLVEMHLPPVHNRP